MLWPVDLAGKEADVKNTKNILAPKNKNGFIIIDLWIVIDFS